MNRMKDKIEKIKNPKKQEKEFSSWWKKTVKNFVPVTTPVFEQRRGPRVLQSLAVSEYDKALVITKMDVPKDKALNYSQPDTGYIYLNFTKEDPEKYKKMVAMHEASHLTLTPGKGDLTPQDFDFVKRNHFLINILEDVRCNRYLCLKYPGMIRYFDSELKEDQNPLMNLCIGDLTSNEIKNPPKQLKVFFDLKDEIRACTTFPEVLEVAKKIVDENKQQKQQKNGCGDGDGDSEENEDQDSCNQQQPNERLDGGLTQKQKQFIDRKTDENEKSARIMNPQRDREEESGIINVVHGDRVEIVKREKEMFLGNKESVVRASLSKHAMKLLMRDYEGWKNTREGRLNKINLSKLYSNGNMFRRRYHNRTPPKAYIVLDGSGSMWGDSTRWQKGLSLGLISLFEKLNIPYQIFIHSGDSGTFYYSEITGKDVIETGSYCYTLDGSMLEALFENEIDPKERAIVFYFSDGQIPAQYPKIQVPLVEKYNMIAEKRGTPIFGIGLDITSVDYFTHWHVVKSKKDFEKTLEKIGKQLGKYM